MHLIGDLNLIARRNAEEFGLDGDIICAIVHVESSWRPYTACYEPGYPFLSEVAKHARFLGIDRKTETQLQSFSWGLMQIMGGTARDMGFKHWLPLLCEPEVGMHFGCAYFATLGGRYNNVLDQIAAYNKGSAKRKPDGSYVNQDYVDKVTAALMKLKQAR